jgi:hypothetical protein
LGERRKERDGFEVQPIGMQEKNQQKVISLFLNF